MGTICSASETNVAIDAQSSIAVGYSYDNDKNRGVSLFFDLGFSNHQHLAIGYSRNQNSQDNSTTERYAVSISSSAQKKFSLDAGFSYMVLPNVIEEYTVRNSINLNLQDWYFAITPQLSAITFFLNSNQENAFDIYAKGAEISVSYFGFEQFYFFSSYFKNHFSEKPIFFKPSIFDSPNLNRITRILTLSKIIELGSGLEKQRISVSVGRFFDWGSLDVTWSYVKLFNISQWLDFPNLASYQADINASSYHASINLPISKHFSTDVLLGWQTTSNQASGLLFGSAGLSYIF